MLNYQVSLERMSEHLISVYMTINQPLLEGQQFWLPDWIPGSYMIRDFSRNIVSLSAECQGNLILLSKVNKSTWELKETVPELTLTYQVYAWDLSVRSAHFDDCHCFFNGTSVFLALKGFEEQEHRVDIKPPRHNNLLNWQVSSSMKPVQIDEKGFGHYQSHNYAEFIDHPFEIADTIEAQFVVDDINHKMIFSEAPEHIDLERIAKDVQIICQYECDFFADEKPPFDSFLFMTFVQKQGFGGLEHMASTALHCSHSDLPKIGDDPDIKSLDYQRFLSLCCHEYFHCWNVKRIKPAVFKPYELQCEINTELLWFFEGITSYYDELFLVRSGVISKEDYLTMLANNITRYLKGKGRLVQTLAESSFDAWTKFYKQDENANNAIVSYYVKGGLVAMCLDFEIKKLTNNAKSLDDLMRLIWNEFGCKGNLAIGKGLENKDIQRVAETLTGSCMTEFFNKHLHSIDNIELQALFLSLDLNYTLVSQETQMDKGGFNKSLKKDKTLSSLSVTHKTHDLGAEIVTVFEGGCSQMLGMSNKDIIIAIDGYHITSAELDAKISRYPLNSNIEISFFRREKLLHKKCRLKETEKNVCYLSYKNETTNSLFDDWIN